MGPCCAMGQISCGTGKDGQSVIVQTLRNQFGGQYIWTRATKSACQVLHLDLWDGQVKVVNRATGYYVSGAALCE